MAAPRQANLTGTVYWSDGVTLFDGDILIGIAYPTVGGVNWPSVYKGASTAIKTQLPQWARIPIRQGVYDLSSLVTYSADIDPPNTQYVSYFYDLSKTRVGGASALFTISTPTYSPVVPSLTLPAAATVAPTPDG